MRSGCHDGPRSVEDGSVDVVKRVEKCTVEVAREEFDHESSWFSHVEGDT